MLSDSAKDGTEDIVSWQPHGMAFRVHKTKEFTETVMQRYFHQTHYKSFQRQLHIYGFRRFSAGLDKGSYYHPMFVKGNETVSLRMTRCKIKGSLAKVMVEEPNFYLQAEPVGSGMVNMAWPDQERSDPFGLHVGSLSTLFLSAGFSATVSSRINADSVLSKAVSLPTLPFSQTRLSQEPQEPLILRHNSSCDSVTPKTHMIMLQDEIPAHHNIMIGRHTNHTMTTMMLEVDFRTLPWSRTTPNRRMSLLEEGDEAFFAGKKFFFVENPSSQQKLPTSSVERRRHVGASGA
jgi:hypothetical protein